MAIHSAALAEAETGLEAEASGAPGHYSTMTVNGHVLVERSAMATSTVVTHSPSASPY